MDPDAILIFKSTASPIAFSGIIQMLKHTSDFRPK